MYLINADKNTISPLEKTAFASAGFRERANLQEWIAANPEILGEPLLIVQMEFDGFQDTFERLDLLALDKKGNLVVIENKLDDSGRDVTWQALKYASYVSTLTREQLIKIFQDFLDSRSMNKNASEELLQFFDNVEFSEVPFNQQSSQRIFLIASKFRKEVTSTVLWLMNYKLRVQCFKATHYELDDKHYLSLHQILPVPDAQEYMISMAAKVQDEMAADQVNTERFRLRKDFWNQFLAAIKGRSPFFQSTVPTNKHWLRSGGLGIGGVSYVVEITRSGAFVYLNFGRRLGNQTKVLFDTLAAHKVDIEVSFGSHLIWERRDDKVNSRVMVQYGNGTITDSEKWPEIISFMVNTIVRLHTSINPFINELVGLVQAVEDDEKLELEDEIL